MNSDISRAETIPSKVYYDQQTFDQIIHLIFKKHWLYVGHQHEFEKNNIIPVNTLPESLNLPLLLSKDKGGNLHCLSNVCTHRGNILVKEPGKKRNISCKYHGRCFSLDGSIVSMPEFKEVIGYPAESDHLPKLDLEQILFLYFANWSSDLNLKDYFKPILEMMNWYPYEDLIHLQKHDHAYELKANWALYVDNYLEGFHIPFVHPQLNDKISYGAYETLCFNLCNVQVGFAKENEPSFDLPENHIHTGKSVFAYYWWVFPNLMINFYTWGISLNVIQPISVQKTRVHYKTFLLKGKTMESYDDTAIGDTELEDQEIVMDVQKGVKSMLYDRGRFSATREQGTHHFHCLLDQFLSESGTF